MKRLATIPFLLLAVLTACQSRPNSEFEEFGERANLEAFGHRYAQPADEEALVMAPNDSIRVDIARNPEISTVQTILFEGTIQMAYLGAVKVAGLTPAQIRDKLTVLMSPYIRDVTIEVVPVQIQSKSVYFFSTDEFDNIVASKLPVTGDLTLIDFIASVGGLPAGTDDCHLRLIRGDPRHPKTLDINVRDMLSHGYTGANIRLLPDDMIWAPPGFFFAVSQKLNRVLQPVRILGAALRDVDQLRFFIETGQTPQSRLFNN